MLPQLFCGANGRGSLGVRFVARAVPCCKKGMAYDEAIGLGALGPDSVRWSSRALVAIEDRLDRSYGNVLRWDDDDAERCDFRHGAPLPSRPLEGALDPDPASHTAAEVRHEPGSN